MNCSKFTKFWSPHAPDCSATKWSHVAQDKRKYNCELLKRHQISSSVGILVIDFKLSQKLGIIIDTYNMRAPFQN